jgi:hypothetical protein
MRLEWSKAAWGAASLVVGVVAVVATVGVTHWRRAASAAAAGSDASFAGAPAPGAQRRWHMDLTADMSPSDDAPPQRVRLTGEWVTTVSAARAHEVDLACEVDDAAVSGPQGGGSPRDETLRRRLSRRFFVTVREDGTAVRAYFPKDMAPEDRNLLLILPTETQLVRPRDAGESWTAMERDGAGLYLASYVKDGPHGIVKRKLRYTELDGVGAASSTGFGIDILTSERRFDLDDGGRIGSYEGGDRLRVTTQITRGQSLAMATTVRLWDPRDQSVPALAGSLARGADDVDASPIRTQQLDPAVQRRLRDERLLSGRSADDLLASAEAPSPPPELSPRLAALFRLHPEQVPQAALRIRRGVATKLLANALGAAGSTEAVRALGALAHDRGVPSSTRVSALTSLMQLQHPAEAMRVPLDLLDDADAPTREAACLTAGALARAGRADHAADADAIDHALADRFSRETTSSRRRELLGAMGNSGGPTLAAVLLGVLSHGAPGERPASARALRFVAGPDVDRALATAIASDPDVQVRFDALFAAGFRPFAALADVVIHAATSDDDEQVRSAAANLLGAHLEAPGARDALLRVQEQDPKPEVRRRAGELLHPAGGSTSADGG